MLTTTFRLCVALLAAAAAWLAGQELANRLQGAWVLPEDPLTRAAKLADDGRWAESRLLADFVVEHPHLGDAERAAELAAAAEQALSGFWSRARRFAHGAVTGEPADTAGMLGSLSVDLFVIGDIRDLAVQGWKQMHSGTGDKLIIALSAVGLTTTVAAHVDWAPALLKLFRRSGALSRRFLTGLKGAARHGLKTGSFSRLSAVVTDFGKAATRLGPGPLRGVMGSVDSAGDLAKIGRAAEIDAKGSYAVAALFGKSGVKRLHRDGGNVAALAKSMKVGSRLSKVSVKAFQLWPTPWLLALFATAVVVGLLSLGLGRRRRLVRTPAPDLARPAATTHQIPRAARSRSPMGERP